MIAVKYLQRLYNISAGKSLYYVVNIIQKVRRDTLRIRCPCQYIGGGVIESNLFENIPIIVIKLVTLTNNREPSHTQLFVIVKIEQEPFRDFDEVAMRQVHQMSTPVVLSVGNKHVRIASVRAPKQILRYLIDESVISCKNKP